MFFISSFLRRGLSLALFLFCNTLLLLGQTSFTGQVTDDRGEPLIGANLFVPDLDRGTATDDRGFFDLGQLPKQDVKVVISYVGYQTRQTNINSSQRSPVTNTWKTSQNHGPL